MPPVPKPKSLPNSVLVLKALEAGQTVNLLGQELVMADNDRIGIKVQVTRAATQETTDQVLETDIGLNTFLDACNKLTFDEVFLLTANRTLTNENRRKH